jgi:hypothetical protein
MGSESVMTTHRVVELVVSFVALPAVHLTAATEPEKPDIGDAQEDVVYVDLGVNEEGQPAAEEAVHELSFRG